MRQINRDALSLPIYEKRDEIISALREHQVIVVAGQTGSGKTTQLPLFCLDAGRGRRGRIGCTQPRRIAATSIAARVAEQFGCRVGEAVGYKIRFAAQESPQTAIKFMTDGILLAEIEYDRNFSQYDTIIIDEAHERSLNIDFLLGYLRELLPRRPDLKVIISSATIDAEGFSKSFGNAPVIEVSGRLYPIEILYKIPNEDKNEEDKDDGGYVMDAVKAVFDLFDMYGPGDMLVFMPTERDIRETCDKLYGMIQRHNIMILPLFSRLTRAEQEAIFSPCGRDRIVVCTNIAETSITVPNIRYVVDTGLARISRYAPRLRTNRLPIEPVSRASADQRKGRCGRVREGVCIRLYSEEDYLQRDEFTQPEIKRSNLAGVILTMTAHNFGAVESFPFIEPPSKQAIFEGYSQLKELGALDKGKKLTPMGREMAKLPFDPHISRMIIAAHKENALREVKIIAAGLSIVDPRERPFDKRAEADAVHMRFTDANSDFLTYINIWDAYQYEWDTLKTQGRIRQFCSDNFLSYTRMREWHDVHKLLDDTLSQMREYTGPIQIRRANRNVVTGNGSVNNINANTPAVESSQPPARASSDAIHRSLLTGLLANCAHLDVKTGKYRAAGGKEILIFPGSALAKRKCEWVMCHEIVETSRVFARTVSNISPQWLEELAADFCKRTFESPYFDAETGYVRATERVTLFGMPLAIRKNALYSRAEPKIASEIFIRDGLVDEKLVCHHRFYEHNKQVKSKILLLEDKLRSRTYYSGDDVIFDFYSERLPGAASIQDLNQAIKSAGGDKFLFMKEEDILNIAIPPETENYPDHVNIGNRNFALRYAFLPGEDNDGVTLALPQKVLPFIEKEALGWLLPALWPDRIKNLLQQLPRAQRKAFAIPVSDVATQLASALTSIADTGESFAAALSKAIRQHFDIDIAPKLLESNKADAHLDLKLEVRDDENKLIAAGRSGDVFRQINETPAENIISGCNNPWDETFAPYRKTGLVKWPDDDLSKFVDTGSQKGGISVRGYPALIPGDSGYSVDLTFFPSKIKSDAAHRGGIRQLLEIALEKDLAWTERDLSLSKEAKVMCAPFGTGEQFRQKLYDIICNTALDFDDAPRSKNDFNRLTDKAKESLRGIGFRVLSIFEESLRIFADNTSRLSATRKKLSPDIVDELSDTLNGFFTDILNGKITLAEFLHYPRYIRVSAVIIEKAAYEPFKYRQKKNVVRQYQLIHNDLRKHNVLEEAMPRHQKLLNELAMMIREYEISLFAQHVKTLYPISEKRLDNKIEEIKK